MQKQRHIRDLPEPLNDTDISVYLLALRNGHFADTAAIGYELGLPVTCVEAAIERLVAFCLLRRAADSRLVPVNPEFAAAVLILPVEWEINQRREIIHTVREQLESVLPHYASSQQNRQPTAGIEKLTGAVEVVGAFQLAASSCQHEIVSIRSGGTPNDEHHTSDVDLALLARGVAARFVYQHRIRVDLPAKSYVRQLIDAGANVRTNNQLPEAMTIFDRRTAFIVKGGPTASGNALIVRDTGVVQFLCDIFEQLWQSASPYAATEAGYDGVADDIQLAIVRLLAEGATDEVVARHLGMSVRACRRHIAALFRNLDSVSRFQAGVRAAGAGLVTATAGAA